jgi:excisionase family DNA binding protein
MPTLLTIKEAAKRLGVAPRQISDAAYEGRLGDDCFFFVGGRRTIPETSLDKIARDLRRTGRGNRRDAE